MNKHIKCNLLGWLWAIFLLFVTSCSDDTFSSFYGDDTSEEVTVKFSLKPEVAAMYTRDGEAIKYPQQVISDGSRIDHVLFAVYYTDENNNKMLLTDGSWFYVENSGGYQITPVKVKGEDGREHLNGQLEIKDVKKFPVDFSLKLKRGVEYTIAFWAQSSKTNAYNTSDLRKVEINYSEVEDPDRSEAELGNSTPNNDEYRDAFCRSVTFTAGQSGSLNQNVYLYRPLAQINIGTNGYDFEIVNRKRERKFTYSKIRINRAARYLDVVDDKIITTTTTDENNSSDVWYDPETGDYWRVKVDDRGNQVLGDDGKPIKISQIKTPESFSVVDFGYAPIPAYVNYYDENRKYDKIPEFPTHTKFDWSHNPEYKVDGSDITAGNYLDTYGQENFLKVKLYDKTRSAITGTGNEIKDGDNVLGYKYNKETYTHLDEDGDYFAYANLNNHNDALSETFKWLSMTYVLTSSTKEDPVLLYNIKAWLATDASGKDEFEFVNITNVPVQRNWRTNIVGNLLSVEKSFEIKLDRNFAGEYNAWENNDNWQWSGPLAKGVYYDAEKDEIQISSVEGLIWFQRMVNGDLKIRVDYNNDQYDNVFQNHVKFKNAEKGDFYKYYDKNDKSGFHECPSYPIMPENNEIKERILIATHQKYNKNTNGEWPQNSNFHFTGTKRDKNGNEINDAKGNPIDYPAKVRLMADLDLSKYYQEWIPIGFDGKIYDTVREGFDEKDSEHRGFCGIFEGDNHMVANVSTKRFTAAVHGSTQQTDGLGPYDNLQWFGRGFFGQIGGNAKIRNLNLLNVDIYGCNGVGGVVGLACGNEMEISGCKVDGGSLTVTPMYRGDSQNGSNVRDRDFARGVYLGGIVGYFYSQGGIVEKNEVRNLTMQGYRRIGGIIGSLGQKVLDRDNLDDYDRGSNNGKYDDVNSDIADPVPAGIKDSHPASISDNLISNTVIIASNYSTFGLMDQPTSTDKKLDELGETGNVRQSGFAWTTSIYALYINDFVGGHEKSLPARDLKDPNGNPCKKTGNSSSGVTVSEFKIWLGDGKSINEFTHEKEILNRRYSYIASTPLQNMPMLSSWFADEIVLKDNYYGEPSAWKYTTLQEFNVFSSLAPNNGYGPDKYSQGGNTFRFPMNLPMEVDITYIKKDNQRAGLYVESVSLIGEGPGNRSVISPVNVKNEGNCVVFITARNRHQFGTGKDNLYKRPTILQNLVLRGDPYAYTGILVAPNKNMSAKFGASDGKDGVVLKNVAIYDVYKTIALDNWESIELTNNQFVWPNKLSDDRYGSGDNKNNCTLVTEDCNLRGYTCPGKGWGSITYNHTTFERGASLGKGETEYTCEVEALNLGQPVNKTEFKHCYFKAPFIIKRTEDAYWSFTSSDEGSKPNYATSASSENVAIELNFKDAAKCVRIEIKSDAQGNPEVYYYDSNKTLLHKGLVPSLSPNP